LTVTQILSGPFKVGSITINNTATTLQREATAATATLDFDNSGNSAKVDVASGQNFTIGTAPLPVAVRLTDDLSVNSTAGNVGAVTINGIVDDLDNTNVTTNKSITVGGGVLNLNGANTYTGGTVINAGKVVVGNASGLGNASTGLGVAIGDALNPATPATLEIAPNTVVGAYKVTVANAATAAVIDDKSGGTFSTLGALTLGAGANTTLKVTSSGAAVQFGGVTLPGQGTINVGGTSGNATTVVVLGADSLKTGISGVGPLVKEGAGTLQLDGNSTAFTGGFQVSEGKVIANHTDALGASGVTIGNGSLQLDKVFTTPAVNAVTVTNGATATITENSGTGGVGTNDFSVLTFQDASVLTPPVLMPPQLSKSSLEVTTPSRRPLHLLP